MVSRVRDASPPCLRPPRKARDGEGNLQTMTQERLEELLSHVRILMGADKQSGRLYALDLKTDLEGLLLELIEKTKC